MIDQDFLFFVLRQARDDWVSFAEIRLLHVESVGRSQATDEKLWAAIEHILDKGYLIAGDIEVQQGFIPWTSTTGESIAAMKAKAVGKTRLSLSDVCWFALTKLGETELQNLESSQRGL